MLLNVCVGGILLYLKWTESYNIHQKGLLTTLSIYIILMLALLKLKFWGRLL